MVLVTQSETSTGVVATCARSPRRRRRRARSSPSTRSRASARFPARPTSGGSTRRLRLAEGADVAARPVTVSVSDAAWKAREGSAAPRFYLDWERTRVAQESLDAAFTPAVSIVIGLNVALGLILERGLEAAFERARPARPRLPRGRQGDGPRALLARRRQLGGRDDRPRPRAGRRCAAPARPARPLRDHARTRARARSRARSSAIGHIGYFDVFDITTALAGIELALAEAGADIERGVAVTRALETYEHQPA